MSRIWVKRNTSASASFGKQQPGLDKSLRDRSGVATFIQDTAGDVAILFGLMTMAMFMLIGAAVDIGRWLNARDQTIAAIDAAVLAAGRALQTNGGNQADAVAVAKVYYDEATKSRLVVKNDSVSFSVVDNGTAVQATGNAEINTPFMRLAGINELPLLKLTGAENSKSMLAVGGNAELNLEIGMMLDVSGSMGTGTKLQDMKDAAADLVDIVVWQDQSKFKSRISLIPFSGDVRPPTAQGTLGALLGLVTPSTSSSWPASRTLSGKTYTKTACVGERMTSDRYTDVKPVTGNFLTPTYTRGGACAIDASGVVVPLSNDKTALKANINSLIAQGGTAGHVGTAWAYYMLSPKWSSLVSSSSTPVAFYTANTKKIAILMTDGEYNYTYDSKGFPTDASGNNGNGQSSAAQAVAVCQQMKSNGIEVYTVGFDLGGNQTAISTLQSCATDSTKAYNADNGEQLKAAFRDIALKVSSLYLTK